MAARRRAHGRSRRVRSILKGEKPAGLLPKDWNRRKFAAPPEGVRSVAGRPPYITTEIGSAQRLKPPPNLNDRQRAHFIALVAACPAGKFERSDLPLLCRYVELVVICEDAAKQIEADGMVDVEGAPSAWTKIYLAASKNLATLAMRLQLCPSTRAPKAAKVQAAPMSAYEMMALEDDDADTSRPS